MIEYKCPSCGEVMSSPDSMIGKSEPCPKCGNIMLVPEPKSVAIASRVARWTVVKSNIIWSWCKRHKRLVGSTVFTLVILTGFLGWLLPDWLPRPVVTFETPADAKKGMFPSRQEMAKLLAKHGYHPALEKPVSKILRGRMLHMHPYVLDVNNPSWCIIQIWSPIDDDNQVIAISLDIHNKETVKMGAIMSGKEEGKAITYAALSHAEKADSLFEDIIGETMVSALKTLNNTTVVDSKKNSQTLLSWSKIQGFSMECISEYVGDHCLGGTVILKDRSWK